MKKIYKKFEDNSLIERLALDIVEIFETGTVSNFDFSFDVSKIDGEMVKEVDENGCLKSNTSFFIDCKEDTELNDFKTSLFDEDLDGLTDEEEKQLQTDTEEFLKKVSEVIFSKYIDRVRAHIRKVVLPSSTDNSKTIPLNQIDIVNLEIIDYSSIPEYSKRVIKIAKKPKTSVPTEQVLEYIFDKADGLMLPYDSIFDSEKDTNPLFANVMNITFGDKYLYELSMSLYVDYSYANVMV